MSKPTSRVDALRRQGAQHRANIEDKEKTEREKQLAIMQAEQKVRDLKLQEATRQLKKTSDDFYRSRRESFDKAPDAYKKMVRGETAESLRAGKAIVGNEGKKASEVIGDFDGTAAKIYDDQNIKGEKIIGFGGMFGGSLTAPSKKRPDMGYSESIDRTVFDIADKLPKNERGEYLINGIPYKREEVWSILRPDVEQSLSLNLLKDYAEYRDPYAQKLGYKSMDDMLDQIDARLENLQQKINTQVDAQYANSPLSYSPEMAQAQAIEKGLAAERMGLKAVRDARDQVEAMRNGDFSSGFAEGFDFVNFATFGFSGLASDIELLRVLNKVKDGRELSENEQNIYDLFELQSELNSLDESMGTSFWRGVGQGVGGSAEMAPQFMVGMGVANKLYQGAKVGMKAGLRLSRNVARESVWKGVARGAWEVMGKPAYNLIKAQGAGLIASLPMSSTWSNYVGKRTEQFKVINGQLVYTPTKAWEDLYDTLAESSSEISSELAGGFINDIVGGTFKQFGKRLGIEKIGSKIGLGKNADYILGYKKSDAFKTFERNLGFQGFIGEPLSEIWGDVTSNILKMAVTGNGNLEMLKDPNYWAQALAVSTIYGGSLQLLNVPERISYYNDIRVLGKKKADILSKIEDKELHDALIKIGSDESLNVSAQELAKLDWSNYNVKDIARAMDYIRAEAILQVAMGYNEQNMHLAQFTAVARKLEESAYRGVDGKSEVDTESVMYQLITPEGKRYNIISGDVTNVTSGDDLLMAIDEEGNKTTVAKQRGNLLVESTVLEETRKMYVEMFSTAEMKSLIADVENTYESLEKPTKEDVVSLMSRLAIALPEQGGKISLVDGREGYFIDMTEDGQLLVEFDAPNGVEMKSVPFYSILSSADHIAEAQKLALAKKTVDTAEAELEAEATESATATDTPSARYVVGEIIDTPNGKGRIIAVTNGKYAIDHNLANTSTAFDVESMDYAEYGIEEIEGAESSTQPTEAEAQPTEQTQETQPTTAEATAEVTPEAVEAELDKVSDVKTIPTNKDGSVNYDAIDDAKLYAELFAKDMGSKEAAAEAVPNMRNAEAESVKKIEKASKKASSANQNVANKKKLDATKQRIAFYDDVLAELTKSEEAIPETAEAVTPTEDVQTEAEEAATEAEDNVVMGEEKNSLRENANRVLEEFNNIYLRGEKSLQEPTWFAYQLIEELGEETARAKIADLLQKMENIMSEASEAGDFYTVNLLINEKGYVERNLRGIDAIAGGKTGGEEKFSLRKGQRRNDRRTVTDTATTSEAATPQSAKAGLVKNDLSAKLTDRLQKTLDAMAQAMGVTVTFVDGEITTANGGKANARIIGNQVEISWKHRNAAIRFLMGHEFTHRMKDLSLEAYVAFEQSVKEYLGEEEWNKRVEKLRSLYESQRVSISDELAAEEVTADFVGDMAYDEQTFDKYVESNKENTGLLASIARIFRSIADFFRNVGDKAHAKRLDNMTKKLDALIAASSEAVANGAQSEGVRYSISASDMAEIEAERKAIIEETKANGTYLKAPNGKRTNLSPEQWVEVRTKRFKEWFGDWEKAARIEKLRESENAVISGDEIAITENFKQNKKNALKYSQSFTGKYTNADTGNVIGIYRGRQNGGVNEVLQHNYKDVPHIQSIAAIPQIIEKSIYIESQPNNDPDTNHDVTEYQCYVCGLNIGGEEYTVLAKVAVDKNGNRYYDHNLTAVAKGKLIDIANNEQSAVTSGFGTTPDTESTTNSQRKYRELISILQINSSKIVDANGEPKIVEHSTWNEDFYTFDIEHLGESSGDEGVYGAGFYFGNVGETELYGDRAIQAYLNLQNPLILPEAPIKGFFDYLIENFDKEGLRDIVVKQGNKTATMGDVLDAIKAINEAHARGEYAELIEQMSQYWMSAEDRVLEQQIFRKIGFAVYPTLEPFIQYNVGRKEFSEALRNAGYDGVVYDNQEFVAFNPNQIKSAKENIGTYDANNPDIRYSLRQLDASYLDAVERGDMETAQRMVLEAAKLAMPDTKVVDENGNPKVVYHGSNAQFTVFDTAKIGSTTGTADGRGFYFTTDKDYARGYVTPSGKLFGVFLNIDNPLSYDRKTITKAQLKKILKEADKVEFAQEGEHYMLSNYADYTVVGIDGAINEASNLEYGYADNDVELIGSLIGGSGSFELIMNAVQKVTGKSGMIAPKDNDTTHYIVTNPSLIKSADPVTYDDNGNVIPLSERFNPEKEDIRYSLRNDDIPFFDDGGDVVIFDDLEDAPAEYISSAQGKPRITEETLSTFIEGRHSKANMRIREETDDLKKAVKARYLDEKRKRLYGIANARTNSGKVAVILGDTAVETLSLEDQALVMIAEGDVHIVWDADKNGRKGLAGELGLSNAERKNYKSITKGATVTFEKFVHQWYESIGGYEKGIDTQDMRNALIEALSEAPTAKRAIEILRDKYDSAQREYEDAIYDIEASEERELANEEARYKQELEDINDPAKRRAYVRHYEQSVAFFDDMSGVQHTVRELERKISRLTRDAAVAQRRYERRVEAIKERNKNYTQERLDKQFERNKAFLRKVLDERNEKLRTLAEGINEAKNAIKETLQGFKAIKYNSREVQSLITSIDGVRTAEGLKKAYSKAERIILNAGIRQARNDMQRLLNMRLPNGQMVESWVGTQVREGRLSAAEGRRIIADMWRGTNSRGVTVANFVDKETEKVMRYLRDELVMPKAKRHYEKKTDAEGNVTKVLSKDLELEDPAATFKSNNNMRIAELEAKIVDGTLTVEDTRTADGKRIVSERTELDARRLYDSYLNVVDYKQQIEAQNKAIEEQRELIATQREGVESGEIDASVPKESYRILSTKYEALNDLKKSYFDKIAEFNTKVQDVLSNGRDALKEFREAQEQHRVEVIRLGLDAIGGDARLLPKNEPTAKQKLAAWNRANIHNTYWTFQTALKEIDRFAPNGEGEFYNHYMRAAHDANNEYLSMQNAHCIRLAEYIKALWPELKKKSPYNAFLAIMEKADNTILPSVTYTKEISEDGSGKKERTKMRISNAMYTIAMWNQAQYKEAMQKRGITQEVINNLEAAIAEVDDRYLKFMKLVIEEMLPDTRLEYDKVHRQLFGASMENIPNYFPAKVKRIFEEADLNLNDLGALPSTITGSIISRRSNNAMPDITQSFFGVLVDHLQNMDHWAAYAPLIQDLNMLLSNVEFKGRLNAYMPGAEKNGEGKGSLYTLFKTTSAIMVGCYTAPNAIADDFLMKLQKGFATANISWRISTAIKQLSAAPIFAAYTVNPKCAAIWAKNMAMGLPTVVSLFEWAEKNSPSWNARWTAKHAGSEVLARKSRDTKHGLDMTLAERSKARKALNTIDEIINYIAVEMGMIPNAAVDAWVCAVGMKTIYDFELSRMTNGRAEEATEEQKAEAMYKAETFMNATQQSAEGAFVSEVQMQRSVVTAACTTYQNATYALHRLRLAGFQELGKQMFNKEYREAVREKYGEGALGDARKQAYAQIIQGIIGDLNFYLMGIATRSLWALLSGGEDDEEETTLWEDIKEIFFDMTVQMTTGGFLGGNILKNAYDGYKTDWAPALGEFGKALKECVYIGKDDEGEATIDGINMWAVISLLARFRYGVDTETFVNMARGIEGIIKQEGWEAGMMLFNEPKSAIKLVAGRRRKGETVQEYVERIIGLEVIGSVPSYGEIFDEDTKFIGQGKLEKGLDWGFFKLPVGGAKDYKVRNLVKEFQEKQRNAVMRHVMTPTQRADIERTNEAYAKVCAELGWKTTADPDDKGVDKTQKRYVYPQGLSAGKYKNLKKKAKEISDIRKELNRFAGSDEGYAEKLQKQNELKNKLIDKYDEFK